jgi:hypothetical protein
MLLSFIFVSFLSLSMATQHANLCAVWEYLSTGPTTWSTPITQSTVSQGYPITVSAIWIT